MPPKARTRSREATTTSGERVTRSQARSNTSREGSVATEGEGSRPAGALKPDVKAEVSLAYGSPQRNKVPNRLASTVRERNIEGVISDAVDESRDVVTRNRDVDPAVSNARLSPIEEGAADDESTVHATPSKLGQSISFNLEGPVGRSASFDGNAHQTKSRRLSARNLKRMERASSIETEDYVERLISRISSTSSPEESPRSGPNNFMKMLLLGTISVCLLLVLLGTNGLSSAASRATYDLKSLAYGILSPLSNTPLRNWTQDTSLQFDQMTVKFNSISNELRQFTSQLDKLDARFDQGLSKLSARVDQGLGKLGKRIDTVDRDVREVARGKSSHASQTVDINAFAVGSGLLVDPYLTSPTKKIREKVWFAPLLRAFIGAAITQPHTPYAAFQPWEEHGDCWCAAAADGHAQLSVILPRGIAPTYLEIEHIFERRTPDPGATPKDFELWMEVKNDERRSWADVAAKEHYGIEPEERHSKLPALGKNWIRVLASQYDALSPDQTQTFRFPTTIVQSHEGWGGFYPRKFTLRINSVWGSESDHACLYRVKLFGPSPDYKELETESQGRWP